MADQITRTAQFVSPITEASIVTQTQTPATESQPWHKTTGGKVAIGVGTVAAVGGLGYGVYRHTRGARVGNPGGYSYFRPHQAQPNPEPATILAVVGTVLGVGAAAFGIGKVAQHRLDEARKEDQSKKPVGEHLLSSVYADTATLGASAELMDEVALPVAFAVVGSPSMMHRDFPFITAMPELITRSSEGQRVPLENVFVEADGEVRLKVLPGVEQQLDNQQIATLNQQVTFADGSQASAFAQVGRLVTDLQGNAAYTVWRTALKMLIDNPQADLYHPSGESVPALVAASVAALGIDPRATDMLLTETHDGDAPQDRVRQGIQLLGQLAWQTFQVEQAAAG